MKKILIATSALAFASSAFAADVSGYALSSYKKDGKIQSLYNETEVYFSGSKTASNGLTFGATYTIGFSGTSNSSTTNLGGVEGVDPTLAEWNVDAVSVVAVKAVEFKSDIVRNDYANVNTFVSGSFGKVEMGHHNSASKALGTASIAAGKSIDGSITGDATRTTVDNAITYTSPRFSGVQVALTHILDDDTAKSIAVKYSARVYGWGVTLAHGQSTLTKTYGTKVPFTTMATGVEFNRGAFSVSYSEAETKGAIMNAAAGTVKDGATTDVSSDYLFPESKTTRLGLGYVLDNWTFGASRATTDSVLTDDVYVGYDLANGFTVFGENVVAGHEKTVYLGTNITF